jgi:ABC-2 type transport system ATP-binding protein
MSVPMIEVEHLTKRYGDTPALAGLDLAVEAGSVTAVLGPNGAGKTTAVRILATLLAPDAGRARVAGHDVVAEPGAVRERIAVTGQYAALDDRLTGAENLVLFGRLDGLGRRAAKTRASELLDRFDLGRAGGRLVGTYSGGMRRRLDLAATLVVHRDVVFLDEPTTGLDPRSRTGLWEVISTLHADGVTVVLTTQYLEEADRLADRVAIVAHGRVVAEGSPAEIKARAGGQRIEVVVSDPAAVQHAASALAVLANGAADVDPASRRLSPPAPDGLDNLSLVVSALRTASIAADLVLRHPSLDDAFMALTAQVPDGSSEPPATALPGRR